MHHVQTSTTVVPVASLLPSDSPRLDGVNAEHARRLAEIDTDVPPILVHRQTMRVIDGMHRLQAAAHCGRETIEVLFVDAEERDVFVLAVKTNIRHGLPLSHRDRVAAAVRVTRSHPHFSDRLIAELTGLSAKTVAAVRKRSTHDVPGTGDRVGRDGKVRPLSTALGRELAYRIMTERPAATRRQVARETGLSLGTVQDVQRRLQRGESPVPEGQRSGHDSGDTTLPGAGPPASEERLSTLLERLRRDPSLRFSNGGKAVLRLLDSHSIPDETWTRLADLVPRHCAGAVANIARACAASWTRFAERIENRGTESHSQVGS